LVLNFYYMRRFLLLPLFMLIVSAGSYAQKVTYKDEMIYVDEQPYAIMKKQGGLVANYSLRTLDNKEIMMVRFNKGNSGSSQDYTVSFIGTGNQVSMKNDIGFGKKLAKEVVENDLIKSGDINPDGEKRFLLSHNAAASGIDAGAGANGPVLVQRDRTQDIFVVAKKILQANVTIGNDERQQNMVYFCQDRC
jgi:hypothetical protein